MQGDFSQSDARSLLKRLPSVFDVAAETIILRMGNALRNVENMEQADDLAAEVGAEVAEQYGFNNGTDEFDHLVSLATQLAGEAFPG